MSTYLALSFDDGRRDSFENGYPVLKKYHLPATFNVTSGYVLENRLADIGTVESPISVEMLRQLYDDKSIEIAGHGDKHENSLDDLLGGLERLRAVLGVEKLYEDSEGLASPGSNLGAPAFDEVRNRLKEKGVQYIRVSVRYNRCPGLKILMRKVSRILPVPSLYAYSYADTLMDRIGDDDILYSIPILHPITVKEIDAVLQRAIREDKSCILMFHSIVPQGSPYRDNWDYPVDKFESLCSLIAEYASAGKIIPVTTKEFYCALKSK